MYCRHIDLVFNFGDLVLFQFACPHDQTQTFLSYLQCCFSSEYATDGGQSCCIETTAGFFVDLPIC